MASRKENKGTEIEEGQKERTWKSGDRGHQTKTRRHITWNCEYRIRRTEKTTRKLQEREDRRRRI